MTKKAWKKYLKKYNREHKEEKRKKHKKYYQEHKKEERERHRKYYKNHKKEQKEYHKKYYLKNKKEITMKQLKYYREHKEKRREYKLKNRFGITLEQYNELFIKQNGVCAICSKTEITKHLYVDHDHKTEKTRGLLCNKCNIAIGFMEDNVDLLEKAKQYLLNNR